jgi:predicted secreted hydrolase
LSKQEILSSFCKIVFLIFLIQTTFQSEIKIRSLNLKLNINPVLAEQEPDLKPMPYWEGGVRVNGTYNDLPIKGNRLL